jgi:hypothetical protein
LTGSLERISAMISNGRVGSDGDVRVSVVEEFKRCLLVAVDETASFLSSSFSLLGAIFVCGY